MHRPSFEKKFSGQRSKQLPLSSNRPSTSEGGGGREGVREGRERRRKGGRD